MVTPKVEFSKKTQNDFYGMSNTLEIFQDGSKGMGVTPSKLESAWRECDTTDKKAVLFSILFSIGDITARQHNIFESKVESGGNAERELFRDVVIPFLVDKVSKERKPVRLKLMGLITEYTVMSNILDARVVTKKKSDKVQKVINMINVFGMDDVASYVANIITKGTTFQKMCVAKFLTRPRLSKRSKSKKMLEETKVVMFTKARLLTKISKLAKLPMEDKGTYVDFTGFYAWRKEFNQNFESVLFSTGAVKDMDKEEFIKFLDTMPSDARFRVRNRVMFNDKWGQLKSWYTEWEKYKENKQTEQRDLQSMFDDGTASEEDIKKLQKVKKEANVNTGAVSFVNMFKDIVNGTVDRIKVQPFLDKVNLPYNTLTFVDDSGSMGSSWGWGNFGFTPRQFAAFMATIVMSKNPDPEARNLVGLFSYDLRMANGVTERNIRPNSIMNGKTVQQLKTQMVDPKMHFLDNLKRFGQFLDANSTGNGTNVSSIPEGLNRWVNGDSNRLEELQKYPVWTLISDGNFNNLGRASSSLNDFMRKCENYFGYRPYLILIDVAGSTSQSITQFSGIDNVMMVPPNPASIEMFLTHFKDMDVYDVYTPLKSVFKSKRYAPVRNFVGKISS